MGYDGGESYGSSYGYGGYEDGGYYSSYPPGGYLDARNGLTGPDSTAYYQSGAYSSYAYESDRGGVFEQNTTRNSAFISQENYYSYRGDDYHYARLANSTHFYKPVPSSGYGYSYGFGSGRGETGNYSSVSLSNTYSNGYTYYTDKSFNATSYVDGASESEYSMTTGIRTDGFSVAGSISTYTIDSYTAANGYTEFDTAHSYR